MTASLALVLNTDRPYVVRRIGLRWACITVGLPMLSTWHMAEAYAAAARRMHANREAS